MSDVPEDLSSETPQRPRRGDGPRARPRRRGAAARRDPEVARAGRSSAEAAGDEGDDAEESGSVQPGVPAGVDADQEKVARSVALRLLTSAPRSRAQLAQAMAKKDVPVDVAERVLDRFTDVGLIDDAEYAAILVRTRHAERGQARRAIAQELTRKGIDADTAQAALSVIDRDDEDAAALELVRRRAGASAGLPREKRERRLVGMLARKGHHPGSAFRIVKAVLDAEGVAASADRDDGPPGDEWGA